MATMMAEPSVVIGKRYPLAYAQKQVHQIPPAPSVDRIAYLASAALGQTVLDLGASGQLHAALSHAAQHYYGLDRRERAGVEACNLDRDTLASHPDVTLVVCGEVLEHLSNPGHLLDRLRAAYRCRTIFTVPNAMARRAQRWLPLGVENVNIEHVAYYSYRTLRTLLERHGYRWLEFAWFNGPTDGTADGLIAVVEPV